MLREILYFCSDTFEKRIMFLGLSQSDIHLLILIQASGNLIEADNSDALVVDRKAVELSPPPKYQVVMLNDDFTPMEFVVEVLVRFFYMNQEKAAQVMLEVHQRGRAVCGIFQKDIAETKAAQVVEYARQHQFPLLCEIEKVEP